MDFHQTLTMSATNKTTDSQISRLKQHDEYLNY